MTGTLRIRLAGVLLALAAAWGAAPAPAAPATRPAVVRVAEASDRLAGGEVAHPPALIQARRLFMAGEYDAAIRAYRDLLGERDVGVTAGVGMSEALATIGEYEKALRALDKVAEAGKNDAAWHVARGRALAVRGGYGAALVAAEKACALRPDWAPAILLRGRMLETLGRKEEAVKVYKSMEEVLSGDSYRRDAASLVALGRILDRYAILTGRRASEQARNILHNYFQVAYQEVEPGYWPANVAAGMFLLAKHNPEEAVTEFELAAEHNKRIPSVHVGLASLHLREWRFEQCLAEVQAALKINPRHPDALLIKAACLMKWRKFDQVPEVLDAILEVNPDHAEALSLAAARHIRLGEPDEAGPHMERVRELDPKCATLPNTIGEWLSAGRQYEAAETYFKQAMELAPELADPVTNLGLLYMQTGQEAEAREVLARAHELDDYRKDVRNYLKLLRQLEHYQIRETEHFVIKVDGEHDRVLLDQVAEYAERMYREVTSDFDHEPEGKTLIEIFPAHDAFSVRISGKGWIGTVGACTGPVIAMVAPDAQRSQFGTYNWATVLRHEFAHVVTLSATGNRIPHWLTEACAVWEQPDRRNYDAVRTLVKAVREGRLKPVAELNWSFIRPKRRGDRSLAYAQSEWMLEYIITTRGYETVIDLLEGFEQGLTQAEVFDRHLATSERAFDTAFAAWARGEVERWGFSPEPLPDLREARKAAEAGPNDADAHARLAEALYRSGRREDGANAARKALALDAEQTTALAVLAEAMAEQEQWGKAAELAGKLSELDPHSRTAPHVLARCHLVKRNWSEAVAALEELKRRRPLADYSYEQLARLYLQLGQREEALPNLIELHRRTMTEPTYARQIAETYRTMPGEEDKALRYWTEVTRINPYEASAYKAMTEIAIAAQQYGQAVASARSMTYVAPDSAEAWTYLGIARYRQAKSAPSPPQEWLVEALEAVDKALELDPAEPMARRVRKMIEAALD